MLIHPLIICVLSTLLAAQERAVLPRGCVLFAAECVTLCRSLPQDTMGPAPRPTCVSGVVSCVPPRQAPKTPWSRFWRLR